MSGPRLVIKGLSCRRGGLPALSGVSLTAYAGQVHAVHGESGAGKSTLLGAIGGLVAAADVDGTVLLDGRPVRFANRPEAEEAGVRTAAQRPALVPGLSAAANVALGREPTRWGLLDRPAMTAHAAGLLERLGAGFGPGTLVEALPAAGRRAVELARALAFESRLVLFDEPTAELPAAQAGRFWGLVRELTAGGAAVLVATKRPDEVFERADRVTVLRDGRAVATSAVADVTPGMLQGWTAGPEQPARLYQAHQPSGRVVLRVRDLEVPAPTGPRPGRPALAEIGFDLHARELVGLAGAVGSGRARLLEALAGIGPAWTWGEVSVEGRRLPPRSPRAALAAGMALVPADHLRDGLCPDLSSSANVTLAALGRFTTVGRLIDRLAEAEAVAAESAALAVRWDRPSAAARTLGPVDRVKCLLARWGLVRPKVLLLDQPTRGLDTAGRSEVHALLRRFVAGGLAVLVASDDLGELLGLSDRLLVLRGGRLVAGAPRVETSAPALLRAAGLTGPAR